MNNKKKVLHIVGSMNMGGIQTFIMNVFRNINREEIIFDFACMNPKNYFESEIEKLGGKVTCIGSRKRLFHHIIKLGKLIKENEYSIVHIHASHAFSVLDAILIRLINPHIIILFHSHTTNSISKVQHVVLKQIIPIVSDYYLACSEEAAQWMFNKKIISKKDYLIIPNGIDVDKYYFCEDKAKLIRSELSIANNQLVIGHIGRIAKPKNHVFLLDVFNEIKKRTDAILVLAGGDGDMSEIVNNRIKQLGLEHSVKLLGVRDDIPKLLSAMDVFVFPSLHEGLPVSLIEAQASGLPCFISNCITNEVKVTPLIHVLSLNEDPVTWANMVLANKDTNERNAYDKLIKISSFNIHQTVKMLKDIYFQRNL